MTTNSRTQKKWPYSILHRIIIIIPMEKLTVFDAIFEVNINIGKLWNLSEYFDKIDLVVFNKYHFFNKQF